MSDLACYRGYVFELLGAVDAVAYLLVMKKLPDLVGLAIGCGLRSGRESSL